MLKRMPRRVLHVLWCWAIWAPGCAEAQSRPAGEVSFLEGVVKDQFGAMIVGADVALKDGNGRSQALQTDQAGHFFFRELASGTYEMRVSAPGFAPQSVAVRVGGAKPRTNLSITLALATVKETVDVSGESVAASLDVDHGAGTQILSNRELHALPDDPDRFSERLQDLATSAGGAPGQAVVTVDGFLESGRLPPKSAIREVRINPDLFSAEYDKPPYQGGRIEIYTRTGSAPTVQGDAFFYNDASGLDARNAFAPSKPGYDTRRYGFDLNGPVVRNKAGFSVSFEKRDIDQFAVVDAVVLEGNAQTPYAASVAAPQRLLTGSARMDWQISSNNTLAVSFAATANELRNQNVGGFNLPAAAYDANNRTQALRFTDTQVFGAGLLNEVRLGLSAVRTRQTPISSVPAIVVPGAFNGGGAIPQSLNRHEDTLELADTVGLTHLRHNFKFGFKLFGFFIRENTTSAFNGSFLFGGSVAPALDGSGLENISGLEQYRRALAGLPGGTPTLYTVTSGTPRVHLQQWQASGFVQDEWRLSNAIALNLGLRYEAQTSPFAGAGWAPRLGMAFSPDKKRTWTLRARAGIFYDRIGTPVALEAERLNEFHQVSTTVYRPSFLAPLSSLPGSVSVMTVRRLEGDIRPPRAFQAQAGVEHAFPRGWKLQVNAYWTGGSRTLRTRNINAPLVLPGIGDPLLAPRPFTPNENILQFESSGRIHGPVVYVGINQSYHKRYTLLLGYLYFNLRTNSDNPFFQPQNSYSDQGEFVQPQWATTHRVFAVATVTLPWKLETAVNFQAVSGTPVNITTGRDNNGDGSLTDRPSAIVGPGGVETRFGPLDPNAINGNLPRNLGVKPPTLTLDSALSRKFVLRQNSAADRQQTLTFTIRATNLLNHTNVLEMNGVVNSQFFYLPNLAAPPRRIEAGVRYSF